MRCLSSFFICRYSSWIIFLIKLLLISKWLDLTFLFNRDSCQCLPCGSRLNVIRCVQRSVNIAQFRKIEPFCFYCRLIQLFLAGHHLLVIFIRVTFEPHLPHSEHLLQLYHGSALAWLGRNLTTLGSKDLFHSHSSRCCFLSLDHLIVPYWRVIVLVVPWQGELFLKQLDVHLWFLQFRDAIIWAIFHHWLERIEHVHIDQMVSALLLLWKLYLDHEWLVCEALLNDGIRSDRGDVRGIDNSVGHGQILLVWLHSIIYIIVIVRKRHWWCSRLRLNRNSNMAWKPRESRAYFLVNHGCRDSVRAEHRLHNVIKIGS